MEERLRRLVEEADLRAPADLPWPSPHPGEGETVDAWRTEVAALRERHDRLVLDAVGEEQSSVLPVGSVSDHRIAVDGGEITARVYRPTDGAGESPVTVFFHGGGFWMGGGRAGFAVNDPLCRSYCQFLSSVVVNVDYRLAPEHPFPSQLEDCYAAVLWTADHGAELGAGRDRMSLLGISSGGNLAAATALLLRDRGGPPIQLQILVVPALDATCSSAAFEADPKGKEVALIARDLYVHDPGQLINPYVSPALADDLSGLPPAIVMTGDHDPLRDDGRLYVNRLLDSGVAAQGFEYPMTHTVALPETRTAMLTDLVSSVGAVLAEGSPTA